MLRRIRRRIPLSWVVLAVLFFGAGALIDALGFNRLLFDSHSYLKMARGWIATGRFVSIAEDGEFETVFARTPGYPVLLGVMHRLFGEAGIPATIWLQRLAWAAAVLLLFPARRFAAGSHKFLRSNLHGVTPALGIAAGLFTPFVLTGVGSILTETFFTILVFLGLAQTAGAAESGKGTQWRRGVVAGFCFGLATLVRPIGLWIPVIAAAALLLFSWLRPDSARPRTLARFLVALLAVSFTLPILWSARNLALSGHFAFESLNGLALPLHRQHAIASLPEAEVAAIPPEQQAFVREVRQHGDVFWATTRIRRHFGLDEFAGASVAHAVGRAALFSAPGDYIRTVAVNLVNTWTSPSDALMLVSILQSDPEVAEVSAGEALSTRRYSLLLLHGTIRIAQLVVLLLVPAWIFWTRRKAAAEDPLLWVLIASAAYFVLAPAAVTISYGRFLFPVVPAVVYLYTMGPTSHKKLGLETSHSGDENPERPLSAS